MASEKRLIDANNPIGFLKEQRVKETGAFSKGVNKGLNIAISALRNAEITPTVDAVEVVRYKDCKHRGSNLCPMETVELYPWFGTKNDAFCSYGERKEGE